MKKTSNTIVFFGSGPVAAESLRLLSNSFKIEAVITKPRPLHHIGKVPILDLAKELQLSVLTVSNKKSLDKLFTERHFSSKLGLLVDFGIMISQSVIEYFPLGIINSHFSLLPEWRGPDPITFSILSGQETTGVSLMLLVEKMDEGPILAQAAHTIAINTTAPELTRDLILLSHNLLLSTIPQYIDGKKQTYPQATNVKPTYSRKLSKEDGIVDWNKPAQIIKNEVQAFVEWPKSKTRLGNVDAILTKVHVIDANGKSGTINTDSGVLTINCGEKALVIDKLKPAGKPEMTGKAFLAGYRTRI